ncbi:MAG: glycoside hydrolase family 32 protein [Armatimonadota bacterium]|jgi:beta-fructofuranosidase
MANSHAELAGRATEAALDGAARAARDPRRLAYHFMPPSGWMNDPNGLIQWQGSYHVFYQHNPYAPDWGAMHWGHATSGDLVHYEHQPVALAPSEAYERAEGGGGGCFSGSAVDDDGTLTLIYTATAEHQTQCIATSTDGVAFTKCADNPVIAGPPPEGRPGDFRDPKVWRHGGSWYMVVGSREGERGNVLLFRSENLRRWDYVGVACESDGSQGRMWECPDLFPLGDRHLLVVSPIGVERRKSITLVGDFDYGTGRFTPERQMDTDCGPGFYAPQSFVDGRGRRIMIGWMIGGGADCPNKKHGWDGAHTLPRVVSILPDGAVGFQPLPELESLRRGHRQLRDVGLVPGAEHMFSDLAGDVLEIKARFEAAPAGRGRFGLAVRCSADGEQLTRVLYEARTASLTLDGRLSGAAPEGTSSAPLPLLPGGVLDLHVFVDRSSVEVFANGGRRVLSSRIFPHPDSVGVRLCCEGAQARLRTLDAWELEPVG